MSPMVTHRTTISIVQRIAGWIVRVVLVLFIAMTVHIWLDVLVFDPREYERLIGSESACGKARNYCSWRAFVWDSVPDFIFSVMAIISMLWRSLPRRELMLGLLAGAICCYMGWRVYSAHLEAAMS
jgi:hypothetical protein